MKKIFLNFFILLFATLSLSYLAPVPANAAVEDFTDLRNLVVVNGDANTLQSEDTSAFFYFVGMVRNLSVTAADDFYLYEREDKQEYVVLDSTGYIKNYYKPSESSLNYKQSLASTFSTVSGLGFGHMPTEPSEYFVLNGSVAGDIDISDFITQVTSSEKGGIFFRLGESGGPWISQISDSQQINSSGIWNAANNNLDPNAISVNTARVTKIQVYAYYEDPNDQIWEASQVLDLTADFQQSTEKAERYVIKNSVALTLTKTDSPLYTNQTDTTLSENSALNVALASAVNTMTSTLNRFADLIVEQINNLLEKTEDYVIGAVDDPNTTIDESTSGMEPAWIKMRNIAMTLLIMALIIIAFANVLQINLEQYGLNRMIPKIIISIIMAYISWIVFIFFFDMSTALQDLASQLLADGGKPMAYMSGAHLSSASAGNIAGEVGALLLDLILFVGVLICGAILFFTLIIRIVMLAFLLAVAPLACIMNILPFSAKLYKQWWSQFFKWMFMGPLAVIILALGSVIATSATTVDPSSQASGVTTGGNMMIGLLIFGATMYFAATMPIKMGGNITKGWSKVGGNIWKGTGGAGGKAAWKATGIPNAYGLAKQKLTYLGDKNAKLRGNKMAQNLSGGRIGTDQRALERSIVDSEALNYRKQFEQARASKDELYNYVKTSSAKSPKAMGAWQVLQDKDWMPTDLGKAETQEMWNKFYLDNGIESGDSLYWGNRKKHPQLENVLRTARRNAGAISDNPKLTVESLMGGMGDSDYPDIEKDALKLQQVASRLALTEKRAESLKPEQVDALLGNSQNAALLKELINKPSNSNGKSFKDGLFAAVDAKDSGAVRKSLDILRQKAAQDYGDVSLQHLDDQSLLNLLKKRF